MRIFSRILIPGALCFAASVLILIQDSWSQAGPEVIRIGAIFSISKWGAIGGAAELNGLLLARDRVNAAGGIAGRRVELVVEDNQSDLRNTSTAFQKLATIDRVTAIIGPNWADFTEIVVPLSAQLRVPFITPSGWKPGVFGKNPYAFSLFPPHSVAVRPLANFLRHSNFHRVALLVSENGYYDSLFAALKEQLQESAIHFTQIERFNPGVMDYRATIARLKNDGTQAVVLFLLESGECLSFLRQARELKLGLPLLASNTLPRDQAIREQPALANGVIYFDYDVPGGKEFLKEYRSRFRVEPGFASAKAYDALYVIKAAIESCGTARSEIPKCLSTVQLTGASGAIRFAADGVLTGVEQNSSLFQVQDGHFRLFEY